jgi:hypothetical protein
VLEVLLSMAIFLIGSVSIVGLFVTASVLHAKAVDRRTASFIADGLLAEVKSMRFRDAFARTTLAADVAPTDATIYVDAVSADRPATEYLADLDYEAANFDFYPAPDYSNRLSGPILVGSELLWYGALNLDYGADSDSMGCTPAASAHDTGDYVLGPRTWHYVLETAMLAPDPLPATATVDVVGDPTSEPPDLLDAAYDGVPSEGYLVIDEEWMRYDGIAAGTFTLADGNDDGHVDRGWGGSEVTTHTVGTPVTVAREHPYYPGFYYAIQFYPVNATGRQAHVVISVGYRTGQLFTARSFRTVFVPSTF